MPAARQRFNASRTPLKQPAIEPISLDEAKAFLRFDDDSEDGLIRMLISSVRMTAEHLTGRRFITQDWRLSLGDFPFEAIDLGLSPVQSIVQVRYTGLDGVERVLPGDCYRLVIRDAAPMLYPLNGDWPDTASLPDAVQIDMRCGYGDMTDAVPMPIRHWMLLRLAGAFEHRNTLLTGAAAELPRSHLDGLLDAYCIHRVT
ncbi:head-tail connector protein [Chitinimonas sp. PSY-7]|uniref:head-tail connector protein n=1 Tax=Chitinimonas sp. PSY-7 TaxID=3459088 RepID=UPI00404019F8